MVLDRGYLDFVVFFFSRVLTVSVVFSSGVVGRAGS